MKSIRRQNSFLQMLQISLTTTLGLVLLGCSGGKQPNVEIIQDLMESPAIKAQEFDAKSPQNRGMRVPPEHTIPVGYKPYLFAQDYEGAKTNPNPLSGDFSPEVLVTGQKYFAIHCAVCHGDKGNGQSLVADKMILKPPSLLSEKIRGWSDGEINHLIVMGRGLMGPYASHIPKEEWRWAVVNYIRNLQKENK